MDNYLTIGKTAGLVNVNPRTLRFYDQLGLLHPSCRSESGYRLYAPRDIERLKFIIRAKEIGLALEEVKTILSLTEEGLCRSAKHRVGDLLAQKMDEIDNRIKELRELKEELLRAAVVLDCGSESPPESGSPCDCLS